MKANLFMTVIVGLLLGTPVYATPVLVGSLSNVHAGSTSFDVSFYQDTSGDTTYDQVFGPSVHSFVFSSAPDALTAAAAILAAGKAASFNFSPFQPLGNGFILPYADPSFVLYVTGFVSPFDNVFGPFMTTRNNPLLGSFAVVTSTTAVPEPNALFLLAIGAFGFAMAKSRRRIA